MKTWRWMLPAVLMVLAFALAACGGGGSEGDDDDDDDDDDDEEDDIDFVEIGPAAGGQIKLATLSNGTVVALVWVTGDDIRFGVLGEGGWDFETIASASGVSFVDWSIDSGNDAHVCVASESTQSITVYHGGSWSEEALDPTAATPGASYKDCAISVDSDGATHIAYSDTAGGLKYATDENGMWGGLTLEQVMDEAAAPALHVDGGGTVHFAYFGREGSSWKVRAGKVVGSGVEAAEIGSSGPEASSIVLAVDGADRPNYAFRDYMGGSLNISKNGGAASVALEGDFGPNMGFFVDAAGARYLSYYDADGKDLFYAHDADGDWASRSIHTNGDVGSASGVALDADGRAHLLYFGEGSLWWASLDW